MFGLGYYWAINRSYDLMYRGQLFTQRGFAHTLDFRGKPTQKTDFDVYVYGINDRGRDIGGGRTLDASGMLMTVTGHSELGKGFSARGEVNYLSSAPWPTEAAGNGESLHRAGDDLFGNFASSWIDEPPTPGTKPSDYKDWAENYPGADLSAENLVASSSVGELTVRMWGRGEVDDTIRQGWFMRVTCSPS